MGARPSELREELVNVNSRSPSGRAIGKSSSGRAVGRARQVELLGRARQVELLGRARQVEQLREELVHLSCRQGPVRLS